MGAPDAFKEPPQGPLSSSLRGPCQETPGPAEAVSAEAFEANGRMKIELFGHNLLLIGYIFQEPSRTENVVRGSWGHRHTGLSFKLGPFGRCGNAYMERHQLTQVYAASLCYPQGSRIVPIGGYRAGVRHRAAHRPT